MRVEAIRRGDIPGVQIRRRGHSHDTPEALWPRVSAPEALVDWFADSVEAAPTDAPGELWNLHTNDFEGQPLVEQLHPIERVEPLRLVATFRSTSQAWPVATRLTWELTSAPSGTEFSVLHEGFEHLPLTDCLTFWEFYRRRWTSALHRLGLKSD